MKFKPSASDMDVIAGSYATPEEYALVSRIQHARISGEEYELTLLDKVRLVNMLRYCETDEANSLADFIEDKDEED